MSMASPETGMSYFSAEISYGSQWVDLNDTDRFQIAADGTRDNVTKTWRKVTAQSPFLGGTYLIHAVPELVSETVGLWIRGVDQAALAEAVSLAETLFTQFSYRIRWVFDGYRETWDCQLADINISQSQVWAHNMMAKAQFTVPRMPEVTREVFE